MKIKQDFVTNSSSTSYIFSIDRKLDGLNPNSPLSELLDEMLGLEIITTTDGLRKFFGNEANEDLGEWCKIIDNGGSIIYLDIPYGGEVGNIGGFIKKYNGKMLQED